MIASLTSRIAIGVMTCGMALGVAALTPASAEMRHGGRGGMSHGGGHHGYYAGGYRHYGYGYGRGYGYGGPVYGGPVYGYYGAPGCIPVLGLVSGNYCNY